MDNKIVLMAVVAIVLGMLVANMFKEVCGCKNLIEGQCSGNQSDGIQCTWVGGPSQVPLTCPYSLAEMDGQTVRDPCPLWGEGDTVASRGIVQLVPNDATSVDDISYLFPGGVSNGQVSDWHLTTCCGWRPTGDEEEGGSTDGTGVGAVSGDSRCLGPDTLLGDASIAAACAEVAHGFGLEQFCGDTSDTSNLNLEHYSHCNERREYVSPTNCTEWCRAATQRGCYGDAEGRVCKWAGGPGNNLCPYSIDGEDSLDPCTLGTGPDAYLPTQVRGTGDDGRTIIIPQLNPSDVGDMPIWSESNCCSYQEPTTEDQSGCSGAQPEGKVCKWAGGSGNDSCPYILQDGDPCSRGVYRSRVQLVDSRIQSGKNYNVARPTSIITAAGVKKDAWSLSSCCSYQDTTETSSDLLSSQVPQSGADTGPESRTSTTSTREITADEPSFVLRDGCIVPSAPQGDSG